MKYNSLFQILNNLLSILLAVLFITEFNNIINRPSLSYIKYNIPSDDTNDQFSGQKTTEKLQREYIVKTLHFTGNDKKDDIILQAFSKLLKEESLKKHTITIYRIYIPKEASYGRFISLLNLMRKDGYKRYLEWKDFFYVLPNNVLYDY